jgi:hypothetical protein
MYSARFINTCYLNFFFVFHKRITSNTHTSIHTQTHTHTHTHTHISWLPISKEQINGIKFLNSQFLFIKLIWNGHMNCSLQYVLWSWSKYTKSAYQENFYDGITLNISYSLLSFDCLHHNSYCNLITLLRIYRGGIF